VTKLAILFKLIQEKVQKLWQIDAKTKGFRANFVKSIAPI
jgi:hypothetical protein